MYVLSDMEHRTTQQICIHIYIEREKGQKDRHMHTYIRMYVHTYIRTYVHTYIDT